MNEHAVSFWLSGHDRKPLREFGESFLHLKKKHKEGIFSFSGLWALLGEDVILGAAAVIS